MSDKNAKPATSAAPMSIGRVLGLKPPATGDWAKLHGQFCAVQAKRLYARIALHLLCAGLTLYLCFGAVPLPLLASWAVLVALAAFLGARLDSRLADADQRELTPGEFRRVALIGAFKGLVWAVPVTGFGMFGDASVIAACWAITAILVLAAAANRCTTPIAAIAFCLALALVALPFLILSGLLVLALVVLATTLLGALGAVENSRILLTAQMAELGMNEKSEVVSMLLREFEEGEADWLWQVDTHRRLRSVSPRFAFAMGGDPAGLEGESFLKLVSGDSWETGQFPPSLHELADKLKERENFSNLIVQVVINGSRRWWELSGTPIIDERGQYHGYRGVGSDVTTQRESSEKIAYLARFDTLTALPNRMMLNESLGDALLHCEEWRSRCAFLMIDLDRFKAVNDSLGHMIGDRLLEEVSARLRGLIGDSELCGRLGGDEFGVVIRDSSNRDRIDKLSRAIIEALSKPYRIENHTLYVGASVGSAIGPRDGRTVEELMRNSDLALYRAKDAGGGEHYEYEPSLHASAEERRQLEFALRGALANDEFLLNYQPVVDANTEEVVSFEALLRWISEEHGFVSPAKFIPLAEETRLILSIGDWVMQQACAEAANWPEHVKVNVNVSPEQLLEPDFVTGVVRALSRSGLAPQRLEIEVTESIFLRDANVARQALEKVMALGCSVALDDFGTGYSSLGYLRRLKFSTIKVDRSFVQGASQNSAESLAIIRAVVAMAESLNMTTTAEGVETEEEAEMIRNMGCNKIQGFHFGRPMRAEEARAVVEREERRRSA